MYTKFNCYLDLDFDYFFEDGAYRESMKNITDMLRQHRVTICCNAIQINPIKQYAKDCEKEFNEGYIQSPANRLALILEKAQPKKDAYCFELVFSQKNTLLKSVDFIIENNALLISMNNNKKKVLLAKSNDDFKVVEFETAKDVGTLLPWIHGLIPRNFNPSAKHGVNGKGAHSGNKGASVSLLKCTEEEAQELLNTAIADFSEKNQLFNFDVKHQEYIEFFDENASNKWHGFHVEQKDEEKRVPDSIKKYFESKA